MRLTIFLAAFVLAVAAVACGSDEPTPTQGGGAQPTIPSNTVMQPPVGDVPTPDFTLPLATGGTITFSDYRGSQPVAVVFYRGFF